MGEGGGGCTEGVAVADAAGLEDDLRGVGVAVMTGRLGAGDGATGVLREMGPTPTEGVPAVAGPPVGLAKGSRPSLAGTMTITVRMRPQQKAISEPPTTPPIARASLDLAFILYLRELQTGVNKMP